MKSLLRKDICTLRLLLPLYLAIAVIFWSISSFFNQASNRYWFVLFYPSFLFSLVPISSMLQDESDHWDQFVGTLPFSRKQLVTEKFLLSLLFGLFSTLLMLLIHAFGFSYCQPFNWTRLLFLTILHLAYFLIFPSGALLLAFKFGASKSRIYSFVLIAVSSAVVFTLYDIRHFTQAVVTLGGAALLLIPAALFFLFCWKLSIHIYEKRDL